jgi:hypothetical protein
MRRFLITSQKFTGTAELVYSDAEILCCIDLRNALMDIDTIIAFKRIAPVNIVSMPSSFSSETTVIEADFEVTFEMFWQKYNKKINKARCTPLWARMNKADQVKAFYGIDAYDKFLGRKLIREKLDPENFLRNKAWENEWR